MSSHTPVRSRIAYWALAVLSLASLVAGAMITMPAVTGLPPAIQSGSPDAVVTVYVSQSMIVIGAGLVTAGIISLALLLSLTAAKALVPRASRPDAKQGAPREEPISQTADETAAPDDDATDPSREPVDDARPAGTPGAPSVSL